MYASDYINMLLDGDEQQQQEPNRHYDEYELE